MTANLNFDDYYYPRAPLSLPFILLLSFPPHPPFLWLGRQTVVPCPGNKPCLHGTKEVSFLKADCAEFLTSGLKYQHLSPPSPEIDYIPLRVELRDQTSRALLEVLNPGYVVIHGLTVISV